MRDPKNGKYVSREREWNSGEIAWIHTSLRSLDHRSPDFDHRREEPTLPSPAIAASEDLVVPQIAIIEKRIFVRECLTRCLKLTSGYNVVSFPTVEAWLAACNRTSVSLIVLCISGRLDEAETRREISLLAQPDNRTPTIVLSDVEDPDVIVSALDSGARGYIPTSVSLEVAIEAIRLVRAGGMFVPASSLVTARRAANCSPNSTRFGNGVFTARQAAVVEALRRGKANKVIAYELDMRESTVKVHVRNIMKKLKAKNRTEVAFLASNLLIKSETRDPL
jgi:DNA-binding NarL/FixJ family response regulator